MEFKITPSGNIPLQTGAATLDEMTRELSQGFYTTFSTLAGGTQVMGFHAHLQRLYLPAAGQGIHPSVDVGTLRERIAGLAKINLPKESHLRVILDKYSGWS